MCYSVCGTHMAYSCLNNRLAISFDHHMRVCTWSLRGGLWRG